MNPIVKAGERVFSVEGAYNVRDLGGYATKDGRTTNWGTFYRADGLHRLSGESRTDLTGRGIFNVIDLRHAKEVEEKKNVFAQRRRAGVSYHHISLMNPTKLANSQVRSLRRPVCQLAGKLASRIAANFRHTGESSHRRRFTTARPARTEPALFLRSCWSWPACLKRRSSRTTA